MIRTVDLIIKKRDGLPLTAEEIEFFVQGFTRGEIPDYQAAAWLMTVYLRGMTADETTSLTLAMAKSGRMLDLSYIAPVVADKHSTGGIGDKTTLVVAPMVAATGIPVGKMSGRGLGFTGGTLDKLESFPGFQADLSTEQFLQVLAKTGIVVSGQTEDLAPADGKLYALRDVTGTVASIPLIASSVMSKKIATGSQVIVLDVKVGSGAFMTQEEMALELAKTMVTIGQGLGRKVSAVISDMNQPLGQAVGNALEVKEALDTLHGRGPADFLEHCLVIASQMLVLAGHSTSVTEAREQLLETISSGKAFEKFGDLVEGQGGDRQLVYQPEHLPQARLVETVPAPCSGYIKAINAREIGLATVRLGAGRAVKGESIDHAVGLVLQAKIGHYLEEGQALFTIHANDEQHLIAEKAKVLAAYTWSDEAVEAPPLIHQIIP
ncbi:MAG: pyrimidine-nucleoside phosphorylase [Anaerolineae bacterium]